MVFLVEEPSTGDLIYLINDTPTGSSSGMPAGQNFETRPKVATVIRVAVIDNDPMVQGFVRAVLADAHDITVVSAHIGVDDYLATYTPADVVLLDLLLDDETEPATNVIRIRATGARVLVIYVSDNRLHVRAAMRAGASGYFIKKGDSALAEAIHAVQAGEQVLTTELMTIIADDPPSLTPRELEVLHLFGTGSTLLATARRLDCSVAVVRTHLDKIRTKWAYIGEDLEGHKVGKVEGEYHI